ncbi:MAG: hypothetical protein JWP50_2712 [Phenylobacterium sp.]|nr:hypothetical protein [Phenylobacterium sp.]
MTPPNLRTAHRIGALVLSIAVAACCGTAVAAGQGRERVAWPKAALKAAAAVKVDGAQFLSTAQLRRWQVDLDRRGLRATGGPAHERYVAALYQRLKAAGVREVYFEPVQLDRWTANTWSLEIVGGAHPGPVPAASYIPYSGVTPPAGITAPMVYLPPGAKPDGSLAGKIVVFDVPRFAVAEKLTVATAVGAYDPRRERDPNAPMIRPYIYFGAVHRMELALNAVGAAGMVAITERPMTYVPYDRDLYKVPGLYVDEAAGAKLKALAGQTLSLRLKLPAKIERVQTRNLIAIIPGMSDELMVINSHTDGTNGIEDNGPNAIVDMAQYLARLPRAAMPRSVMIMLSSGHFAGGVGIEGFVDKHAGDGLLTRIAAAITIEHLGAQEWVPDAGGKLVATGKFEPAALFTPDIPALIAASRKMQRDADAAPSSVALPSSPKGKGTANDNVWPGEGQYFWGRARIPTVNYITGPYYLLDWGPGVTTSDKVDYGRIHRETVAFTQMLLDLSRTPLAELRPAD